jgi:preprotein translocase subunit SecA
MRLFGSDRISGLMQRLGMEEGVPIEAGMVTRAIERAQKQVEGRNFEIRKHLLEYDDVMNKQREAIYRLRKDILEGREGRDYVLKIADDIVDLLVENHCPEKADPRDWNLDELAVDFRSYFDLDAWNLGQELSELGIDELRDLLRKAVHDRYQEQVDKNGGEAFDSLQRHVMLSTVDASWKDHLLALDHLKEGIGLRGYGQRDPKNEYKRESYELFQAMKERIEDTVLKTLFRIEPVTEEQLEQLRRRRQRMAPPQVAAQPSGAPRQFEERPSGQQLPPGMARPPAKPQTFVHDQPKVGRNDPCPCGSGKKYKKCHGRAPAPVA